MIDNEPSDAALQTAPKPAEPKRLKWTRHMEYILSSLGFTVGLFNVWRFPYVCYKNGGATFLFPYILLMFIVGFPMYYMETILGQFSSLSPSKTFGFIPAAKGAGIVQILIAVVFCSYYAIIMVWALKYLYFGFSLKPLPWTSCEDPDWGQDRETCYIKSKTPPHPPMCGSKYHDVSSGEPCKNYTTASQQFFQIYVLQSGNANFPKIGRLLPDNAMILVLVWCIIFFCISKGIQTSGKVVYATAIFPYIVLVYFALVGFSMEGAMGGVMYLFKPVWHKFLDINVWQAALTQMFLSCGIGIGCVIMYASFNEFQNQLFGDSLFIILMDFFTSILATISVFSVIGFYSNFLDKEFGEVFKAGFGLFFEVLPDAINEMPWPKVGTVLLFLMMFTLGIDSQFVFVETLVVALEDEFPIVRNYRYSLRIVVCTGGVLIGLCFATQGGIQMLTLVDTCNEIIVTYAVFWEVFIVIYLYGINRFADDLFFMNGIGIDWDFRVYLAIIDPIILLILLFIGIFEMDALDEDKFSWWANYIVILIALIVMSPIPLCAIYSSIQSYKNKDICSAFKPLPDWGPADAEYKNLYMEWKKTRFYHPLTIKQFIFKQPFPRHRPLKKKHEHP